MQIWSRRRVETIVLAILGMGAVMPFRFHSESRAWFLSEIASVCFLFLLAIVLQTWARTARNSRLMLHAAMGGLCVTPILFGVMARASGAPIPYEMTALTTFGAASIGMGLADSSRRLWSLSLVVSGFLVLFCAAISDSQKAISLPLVWVLLCVWHLVANRWERLDLAMPESVERNWSLRPRIVVVALIVLTAGAYVMQTQRLSSTRFEFGLMPTSGGAEWS
ncbi:MAG: transglutaminase domain-containing protein, partial [Rubripirellula sp.]